MATKKEIRGVIVPRHDTAINWSKAVNFTPENGELIIISADDATDVARGYYLDSEGNKLTSITVNSNGVNKDCAIRPSDKVRFKFGNGKDNVNALPFQTEALQGTASGSVIQIDDISPVTHNMGVKIRSKNLIDFDRIKNANEGLNGFDTVTKENNAVTVTDSNSDIGTTNMCPILELYKGALPEGTYTFSMDYEIENSLVGLNTNRLYLFVDNVTSGTKVMSDGYGRCTFTFTLESASDAVRLDFYKHVNYDHEGAELDSYANDAVYKATFADIQLELGTTATEYTPYVADLSAVGVSRLGKNITPYEHYVNKNSVYTTNGVTFTDNGDGSITANGTATKDIFYWFIPSGTFLLHSGTLTFSGCPSECLDMMTGIYLAVGQHPIYTKTDNGAGITFKMESAIYAGMSINIPSGVTCNNITFKPQLEYGSIATDYEPYIEPQTVTANADGTVEGLTSLYPNTTLMTDTEGVLIDCEYLTKSYTDILGSTNLRNGSAKGSIRSINSKAEDDTYTIGTNAFAEGNSTKASGDYSHAEGNNTTASGSASHAEGANTKASGNSSHAEGNSTTAGQMGFKVTACEKLTDTTGTYTLTSLTGLSTNRRYSVHLSSSKKNCGKITAIDTTNKKITVDGYPDIALSTSSSSITNYLTIVNKPDLGDILISGNYSHAEGFITAAVGNYSHAEGDNTQASGNSSHAEGARTTASGDYSHAEGSYTTASGSDSHAEGKSTQASGDKSHAEGFITAAVGNYSHAEGFNTRASGSNSHAEGESTTASSAYQHVQGKYNIEDKNNTYADIIGNGSSDTKRSNAATVDWQGNAWYAGDVYVGSTSGTNKDEGSKKLATEEYTNNIINKKIEVSETAPTEEENKIWLQPMITNVGAVDYIVEQGISGIWTYRKWKSGCTDKLISRQFFNSNNPDVLGYAQSLMTNGFDGVVTIQIGMGATAPIEFCLGQIICNGSDRCEVILYGQGAIYTNHNVGTGWLGWYKFSGTKVE